MKRIMISVSLFTTIVSLSIFGTFSIQKMVEPSIVALNSSLNHYQNNNFDKTLETTTLAYQMWDKHTDTLAIMLRHNELDVIDANFIRVLEIAKTADNSQFAIECQELIHRLSHLIKKESISIKNIL